MAVRFNNLLRDVLLGSRWAMAPLCIGLIAALAMIIAQFYRELVKAFVEFTENGTADVIVAILKLVDLVLIGNLVVIIIAAGVSIYMPKIDTVEPAGSEWSVLIDFSSLKLKVIASISAIIVVHLLERLLYIDDVDKAGVLWEIIGLTAIVGAGVLLALMDRLAGRH